MTNSELDPPTKMTSHFAPHAAEAIDSVVADLLVSIGAVHFDFKRQYSYASGITSPIYCDCRLIMSYPRARSEVVNYLCSVASGDHSTDRFECVAGVAIGAIPIAALVADRLRLPLIYVRPNIKLHGTQKAIEGALPAAGSVLLVEDTISTGRSAIAAAVALQAAGCAVAACVSVMDYQLAATQVAFSESGLMRCNLTTLPAILRSSQRAGLITDVERSQVLDWWNDGRL